MIPYLYGNRMTYNVRYNGNMVKDGNTVISNMFQRYLWQDLIGVIKWDMPDYWSYDYFTYTLYYAGYIAIINTDKFGVIPQYASPMGYNVFYEPVQMVISNPLLKGITEPYIGTQCAVIRITPDWFGMEDIVSYYAGLMAEACSSIGVNLVNSKLAYLLFGGNQAMAQTLKGVYARIASGEPAVVVDKDCIRRDGSPNYEMFNNDVGGNYIVDRLLADLEKIHNQFRTYIGIPNANTEKRERQIVDEVNSNNVATKMLTENMLERAKHGIDQAHKLFPSLKLSAKWRCEPREDSVSQLNGDTKDKSKSNG